jgi:hypothetical protein
LPGALGAASNSVLVDTVNVSSTYSTVVVNCVAVVANSDAVLVVTVMWVVLTVQLLSIVLLL